MAAGCAEAYICQLPPQAFQESGAAANRDGAFDAGAVAHALPEHEGDHEETGAEVLVNAGVVDGREVRERERVRSRPIPDGSFLPIRCVADFPRLGIV